MQPDDLFMDDHINTYACLSLFRPIQSLTLLFFLFIVVFKQLDEQFLSIARQDCSPDGATCLLGVVLNGRLTVANIGDSVATLARKDGSWVQLNSEHSPVRPDERARIEAANGSVFLDRINGELSVSRAFGDYEMKDLVIS